MPLSAGIVGGPGKLKDPSQPWLLGYRTNLVANPTFEVDTASWTGGAGGVISRTTSEAFIGSASLQVDNSSASFTESALFPLVLGEGDYIASAYVKLAAGNAPANYFLRYLQYEDLGQTSVSSGNFGTQALSVSGDWVRLSGTFTKTGIANYAVIRVVTNSTTNTDVFYVDAVMVEKGTTLGSYYDGSSNGFWSGTSHNSISGATPY
jgi:hypothetical protein